MKKYFYEAQKKQLEKPTEPLYVYCTTAKCIVYAETEAEALKLAEKKLTETYFGTGVVLGKPNLTKVAELPVDWSYGYEDARKSGNVTEPGALLTDCVIR